MFLFFFFQAEDGIRDYKVTGVQTCALPISGRELEEGFVQLATSEAGIENVGVDASGNGAKALLVKKPDQLASVALPDGEERGHADAGEVFLAVGPQVFKEDIAEGDPSNTLAVEEAERFFHARLVDGIDALRRDRNFVQRQTKRFCLPPEKFTTNAVHGDALISFSDGGEQCDDAEMPLLLQGVQRHGAVFATAPAEQDRFACVRLHGFRGPCFVNRDYGSLAATSVVAAETVVHAHADIATERRKADNVLIFLVEKICRPRIQGDPAREFVAGGQIEAGLAA